MKQHLNAYTVQQNAKGDYWTRIGAAFPTKNGGFTLLLNAVPPTTEGRYRIVLQQPKPATAQRPAQQVDLFDDPMFPFDPELVAASRQRRRT